MRIGRGFSDSERGRIAELYWEAFGPKLGRTLGPDRLALHFIARNLDPDHALCARDDSGRLLGAAGFKTLRGGLVGGGYAAMRPTYGWIGAAWRLALLALLDTDIENRRFLIDGIFVDPAARGQGVGTALLAALGAEGRARGYAEIRLEVIEENLEARRLYEREGFVAIGHQNMGWLAPLFGFGAAITMVRRLDGR